MKKPKRHAAAKSIIGIVLLLVIFAVIVGVIGYRSFTDAILSQHETGAFLVADTAAEFIDADRMDAYDESGGTTEEYLAVFEKLDRLCNTSGSTFIYVIRPDRTDYAHIRFLFSTIDHTTKYSQYEFGYLRETTNDEYKVKYRNLYEKTSEREVLVRDRGYIETDKHITAMVGLKGSDGEVKAILCVQRQLDTLSQIRKKYLDKIALVVIGLVALVTLGQSIFLHRVLLRPLNLISEETLRFAAENTVAEKKLRTEVKSNDEIGVLAASIDEMEERILENMETLTRVTAEKERIGTELSLATRIQEGMLPSTFPPFPDRAEFDLYASMDPAKEVGGDFYDFFLVDPDHLCLVMADVSGKGVPAALFMMAAKIILADQAAMGRSPAEILTRTNEIITAGNKEEMFVTVWLGILEISTGHLTAANAGHEYPVLKRANGSYELMKDRHGFVIGGMAGMKYHEYALDLEPGSKLFLYTDGVPEATSAEKELFGTERMLEALNADTAASPKETLQNVLRAMDEFVQDAEQFDDITMLLLEYRGRA